MGHPREGVIPPLKRRAMSTYGLCRAALDDARDQAPSSRLRSRAACRNRARCGFDPVGAVSKVNLIAIQREDLGLRVSFLNLNREQRFLDFAFPGLFRSEKEIARELLRERAGAGALRRSRTS